MPKKIPPESPEFCWAIAEAAYERGLDASNSFLQKHCSGAKVLAEESIRGWRFILVQKNDQLSVAFQGTDRLHHLFGDGMHEIFGATSGTVSRMEKVLDGWEKAYGGKISLFSSHSAGATWAEAVRRTDGIAKVFFNSHKAWLKDNHWHLTTQDDILARFGLILSGDPKNEIDKYMVIGPGGHGLDNFESLVKGRDWGKVGVEAQKYSPEELRKIVEGQRVTLEFNKRLTSGETLLDNNSLKVLREDLKAKNELLQKAKESQEFLQNFSEATKVLASKIHEQMIQDRRESEYFWQQQQQNKELLKRGELAADVVGKKGDMASYAALAQMTYHHLHPENAVSLSGQIEELTKLYQREVQRVIADLGQVNDVDAAIQSQFARLDQLDQAQQKVYKNLLSLQKEISSKYRNLQLICSGIGFICSVVPGCHVVAKIAATAAGSALEMARTNALGKNEKALRKQQEKLKGVVDTKEALAAAAQKNRAAKDAFVRATVEIIGEFSSDSSRFVPAGHRDSLSALLGNLQQEIDTSHASTNQLEQRVRDAELLKKAREAELVHLQGKRGKKQWNRDPKRYEEKERSLIGACAQQGAKLTELKEELEGVKKSKGVLTEQLSGAQRELDKANRYSRFRDHTWHVIQSESQWLCAETEAAKELRLEMQSAFRLYHQARAEERELMHGLFGNAYQIAVSMGYQGNSLRSMSAGYQLYDHCSYWWKIALPQAREGLAQYNGNVGQAISENLGVMVGQFLVPALGTILAGVQLVQGLRAWINEAPPNQKSIHQLMMEEINSQLCLLDKGLREVINLRFDQMDERTQKRLVEIKEIVSLSTEHLKDQITDLRKENVDLHAEQSLSAFLTSVEQQSRSAKKQYEEMAEKLNDFYRRHYTDPSYITMMQSSMADVLSKKNDQNFVKEVTLYLKHCISSFRRELQTLSVENKMLKINGLRALSGSKHQRADVSSVSGILGVELNDDKVPNWKLLSDVSQGFFGFAYTLTQREELCKIVLQNKELTQEFLNLCRQFSGLYDRIGLLRLKTQSLIEKIQSQKSEFLKTNGARISASNLQRSLYVLTNSQRMAAQFKWDALIKDMVADQKFALHNECFVEFNARMESLKALLSDHHFEYHKTTMKVSYVVSGIFSLGICFFIDSPRQLSDRLFLDSWKATWERAGSSDNLLTYDGQPQGRSKFDKFITEVMQNQGAGFKAHGAGWYQWHLDNYGAKKYRLVFDLRSRKVSWINSAKQNQHLEFMAANIFPTNLMLADRENAAFCNAEMFRKIQGTQGNSNKDYRKSLTQLIEGYRSVLQKLSQGQSISQAGSLAALAEGEIINSSHPDGLPLIFPKKLLRQMELLLGSTFRHVLATGQGVFIPKYEFSTKERSLIIQYEMILNSLPDRPYKYMKFKVASFDLITWAAFKPDLTSDSEDFAPTEFLIQAMYGKLAQSPLGLPGKGSLMLLDFKQVAPLERSFQGLYKLWEQDPTKVISYDSQTIDETIDIKQFMVDPIVSQVDEDFINVFTLIEKQKKELVHKEEEYKRLYDLLMMMISLYSNMDQTVAKKRLSEELGIFSPEHLEVMYDLEKSKVSSAKEVQLFMQELFASPSLHVRHLTQLQEQIYDVEDWLLGRSEFLVRQLEKDPLEEVGMNIDELLNAIGSVWEKSPEIKRFTHNGNNYSVKNTSAVYKACALHALLGSPNSIGNYYCPDARKRYVEQFRKKYVEHQQVIHDQLVSLLKDFKGNPNGPYLKEVFGSMGAEIQILDQQILAAQSNQEREDAYFHFFDKEDVREKYLAACLGNEYYFSDCELAIAAHLFDKKVHMFTYRTETEVFDPMSYGPANGENIYIFHQGDHYSRSFLANSKEESKESA